MQLEVEIKAWVRDQKRLEHNLTTVGASVSKSFEKVDSYFRYSRENIEHDVRIRGNDGTFVVTYKDKTITDGLEVNQEHEFTVSDPAPMGELLVRLGARPLIEKHKIGALWKLPDSDLNIEISEVSDLGIFVEIEAILDPHLISEAQRRFLVTESERTIRTLLSKLEIPARDIEARTYTSMLLEKQRTGTL